MEWDEKKRDSRKNEVLQNNIMAEIKNIVNVPWILSSHFTHFQNPIYHNPITESSHLSQKMWGWAICFFSKNKRLWKTIDL